MTVEKKDGLATDEERDDSAGAGSGFVDGFASPQDRESGDETDTDDGAEKKPEGDDSVTEKGDGGKAEKGDEGGEGEEEKSDKELNFARLRQQNAELLKKVDELQQDLESVRKTTTKEKTEKEDEAEGDLPGLKLHDLTQEDLDLIGDEKQIGTFKKIIENTQIDLIKRMMKEANKARATIQQSTQSRIVMERESVLAAEKIHGGGEFGHFVKNVKVDDRGNLVSFEWDKDSPLFKRAEQIYNTDPRLARSPVGLETAVARASNELMREKYAAKSKKSSGSEVDRVQRLTNTAGADRRGDAAGVKKGSRFHRKLTDEEFDALPYSEQEIYLEESKINKWE